MDGREGMTMQGSTPYYLHRTIQGTSGGQPGFRPSLSPNLSAHPISSVGPIYNNVQGSQSNVGPQGFSISTVSGGSLSEPTKKKRGRPRKYGPGCDGGGGSGSASGSGSVALVLSPSSPNSSTPGERKKRGRPPGSGRKQRLSSVGEWMNNSAGIAFTPHVIHVARGEDIASKILSFSQQRPRALCIMSGSGGVSSVTLRQPASTAGTVTFEGRFQILCLSGSYLVAETGGAGNRTGGVNVSLSSPDGHVIGGAVGGRLIASMPVQVVVCSFVYDGIKGKSKESDSKQDEESFEQPLSDKSSAQINTSSQNVTGSWPCSKGLDLKNPKTDIDLASG